MTVVVSFQKYGPIKALCNLLNNQLRLVNNIDQFGWKSSFITTGKDRKKLARQDETLLLYFSI